jgi:23S rRNA (adenine2503-C2)-methyltransferase
MDKDLKNKTVAKLEELVVAAGQKKFIAWDVFSFIHARGVADINDLTTLSKVFRAQLIEDGYFISQLKTVETFEDPDGTVKFLFELGDGARIETVLLRDESDRLTLCISTQVGCKMNCSFCATGRLHFTRDLKAGEIADQVIQASRAAPGRIANVVYMGMGEPLDNYDETLRSIYMLNDPAGLNIGARHITISTSGIVEGIEKLSRVNLQVRLAVSLHGPTDAVRTKIMNIARKYPLDELLGAVRNYQSRTGRRVTFEYIMIKDINDTVSHARLLAKVLAALKANINLIEYNPHPGCDFVASSRADIRRFQGILEEAGFEVVVRYKRGQHIKAACGQLGATWLKPQKQRAACDEQ